MLDKVVDGEGFRETKVCVESKSWRGVKKGVDRLTEDCWLAKPVGEHSRVGAANSSANELEVELFVNIFYIISTFITKSNRMFSLYMEGTPGLISEG